VGSRIAVLAEPGDDLSSLEIPAETSEPSSASQQDSAPLRAPPAPEPSSSQETSTETRTLARPQPQKYPLYPSVAALLHTHNLSVDQIPASGPNGRLLKGDVLAYLKEIPSAYPQELSERLAKLTHLDLSNIKVAAAPPTKPSEQAGASAGVDTKQEKAVKEEKKALREPRVISRVVSLSALRAAQLRTQEAMGVAPPPLNQLVVRAFLLANQGLPAAHSASSSAEELFDALVGSSRSTQQRKTKCDFVPTVVDAPVLTSRTPGRSADLFDEIVGAKRATPRKVRTVVPSPDTKILSLNVENEADEKRASLFLEKVKFCVENEPARLMQFWPAEV
jgi:e3 binding domain